MKNILVITFVCLCAANATQAATTYDLGNDWETGQPLGGGGANPNGPWQYGHQAVLGADAFTLSAHYQEYDHTGDGSMMASQWLSAAGTYPVITHSFTLLLPPNWAPGDNVMETYGYQNTEHGTVRWTAPSEGLVNINIDVAPLPSYVTPSVVIVLNRSTHSDPLTDPNDWVILSAQGNPLSYDWTGHHIQAGDTIDLVVSGAVGNSANWVDMVFELYTIGEPGAPAENNIPNPNPPLPPFDPEDPNAVWDLSQQFSHTVNPGSYWSYGWSTSWVDFNLYLDTWGEGTDNLGWYDPVNTTDPLSNGPLLWKAMGWTTNGVPYLDVAVHSGPGLFSVARWTSVIDDFVACTGQFGAGDSGLVDVYVVKNGSEILQKVLAAADDVSIDAKAWVEPGTTIDFAVGPSTDNIYGDSTPLNVQITRTEVTCPYVEHLSTDFNNDCYINLEDFALFAKDWLKCNNPMDPTCTDEP